MGKIRNNDGLIADGGGSEAVAGHRDQTPVNLDIADQRLQLARALDGCAVERPIAIGGGRTGIADNTDPAIGFRPGPFRRS